MGDNANIVRDRSYYRMLPDSMLIKCCKERTDLSELETVLLERLIGLREEHLRAIWRADNTDPE